MTIVDIILIGIGLSMDAVAVSAISGMSIKAIRLNEALTIAFAFGLFQGIMPLLGFLAGSVFTRFMSTFAPWVALVMLGFVGGKMIWESRHGGEEQPGVARFSFKVLLVQAVATSLDALAVGVSFAAVHVDILWAASVIAAITFALSLGAVYIGRSFGCLLADKAELVGGIILVLIGIKMVL